MEDENKQKKNETQFDPKKFLPGEPKDKFGQNRKWHGNPT